MAMRGVAAEGGVARVEDVVAVITAVVVVHEPAPAAVAEGRLPDPVRRGVGRSAAAEAVPHPAAVRVSAGA